MMTLPPNIAALLDLYRWEAALGLVGSVRFERIGQKKSFNNAIAEALYLQPGWKDFVEE